MEFLSKWFYYFYIFNEQISTTCVHILYINHGKFQQLGNFEVVKFAEIVISSKLISRKICIAERKKVNFMVFLIFQRVKSHNFINPVILMCWNYQNWSFGQFWWVKKRQNWSFELWIWPNLKFGDKIQTFVYK